MATCMLWETIYERRERFVLAVPRTRLHTLEVTLIVSVLELYGRTHLIAFGGKGGEVYVAVLEWIAHCAGTS